MFYRGPDRGRQGGLGDIFLTKIVNGLIISEKRSILDNGQDSECLSISYSTQSPNICKNEYGQFLEFSLNFL